MTASLLGNYEYLVKSVLRNAMAVSNSHSSSVCIFFHAALSIFLILHQFLQFFLQKMFRLFFCLFVCFQGKVLILLVFFFFLLILSLLSLFSATFCFLFGNYRLSSSKLSRLPARHNQDEKERANQDIFFTFAF